MEWFYPESIEEAVKLLENGFTLHGGGTGILMGNVNRHKGFISLKKLGISNIEKKGESLFIGAMSTYSDVIEFFEKVNRKHILVQSLSLAASTPLRNRITIGGSIAFSPQWSDLIGPLVALNAEVRLEGKNEGWYPVERFIKKTELKKHSLITGIRFPDKVFKGLYYRAVRTRFDFASFNLTVLKGEDGLRIVVVGTRERVSRMKELENMLLANGFSDIEKAVDRCWNLKFSGGRLGSAEYINHLARVELVRLLETLG